MLGLPVYDIIYYDTVSNTICEYDTSYYIVYIDEINGVSFLNYGKASSSTLIDFGKMDCYIPVLPGFDIKLRTYGNIICNEGSDTISVSDSIIEIKVEGKDICNQVNDIVVKVGSGS